MKRKKRGNMFEKLKEEIKQHEKWRSSIYTCPAGKLSIGYGRNLEDVGISKAEGEMLFDNDFNNAVEKAERLGYWKSLPQNVKEVVIDMIFNMGYGSFLGFKKFRKALLHQDWQTASEEIKDSNYYRDLATHLRAEKNRLKLLGSNTNQQV